MMDKLGLIGKASQTLTASNISSLAKNLVVGYKFYVFIGPVSLAFNKISGIEKIYNYQSLQEGGINNNLRLLRKPLGELSTMILEDGGMKISAAKMKLYFNGSPQEILILLCTSNGSIHDVITVNNAVVSKVSISPLDSQKSELVVNTIEMIYTDFTRVAF